MPTPSEAIRTAQEFHQRGDLAAAERRYRAVLAADANHFDALLLLSVLEHQRRNHLDAHALIGRALELDRGSAAAHLQMGLVLRALRRTEEALASYDTALSIQPGLADALFNRGNALQALDRLDDALQSYDAALALQPADAGALNNRGVVLGALGRHGEALASYDRALASRPRYAEAWNNRGIALYELGSAQEALESYDRAIAAKSDYAEALNNRGNALRALGRQEEALASYERALSIAPEYAEARIHRGMVLLELRRHERALENYDRVLVRDPDNAEALKHRGDGLQALDRFEEALASYDRAVAVKPGYAEAWTNRGNALLALDRNDEALSSYERALAIRPDYVEALNNRGNALLASHRYPEALAAFARAIELRPGDAEAHWNEGLARLLLGDFAGGWAKYEWRHRNRKLSPEFETDRPRWLGTQNLAGKTVLLHPEQGFGDAIQFVRYARLVAERGATVTLACHESLRRLFSTVEGVAEAVAPDRMPREFDYHAPLMSLPLAFGTSIATIPNRVPYVHPQAESLAQWRARLGPADARLRIGLAWSGNPKFAAAKAKSCPIDLLAGLLGVPGCVFFSLQKGEAARELETVVAERNRVTDLTSDLADFSETAALVSLLDVVITIDTAVAHLAGALGKEVWILLPFNADWRWLVDRGDSPWYPSARLFRQRGAGDWEGVVQRVSQQLSHRAGGGAPA